MLNMTYACNNFLTSHDANRFLPSHYGLAKVSLACNQFLPSQDEVANQASKKTLRRHPGSKPASKYLKTTGEQRRITANNFRCILNRVARSMSDLVSKNGRFGDVSRTTVVKAQDDRWFVQSQSLWW